MFAQGKVRVVELRSTPGFRGRLNVPEVVELWERAVPNFSYGNQRHKPCFLLHCFKVADVLRVCSARQKMGDQLVCCGVVLECGYLLPNKRWKKGVRDLVSNRSLRRVAVSEPLYGRLVKEYGKEIAKEKLLDCQKPPRRKFGLPAFGNHRLFNAAAVRLRPLSRL